MADNLQVTEGSGVTIAADEIGGVKYQRIKLGIGTDGEADDLDFGQAAMAESLPVVLASDQNAIPVDATLTAGELFLGQTSSPDTVLDITLSTDTNAYSDGDVLADTQELASAARVNGGTMILQSVVVLDESDQGVDLDLIFFNANTSLGTENSAPNIDDAGGRTIIGRVSIVADDFYDLGAFKLATKIGIGLFLKAGGATTSIYVGAIARGTATYSASALKVKLGIFRD